MQTTLKNEDVLHLLTGRTPLHINRLLSAQLKEMDISITKEQWSILAVLWSSDGCTQQTLADATYRDRPGVTRLLDHLEKLGLTERKADKKDRRVNLIFLTKKGRVLEKQVVQALKKTIEIITQNISPQQIENLRKTFNQINKNIQNLDQNFNK